MGSGKDVAILIRASRKKPGMDRSKPEGYEKPEPMGPEMMEPGNDEGTSKEDVMDEFIEAVTNSDTAGALEAFEALLEACRAE